MLKKGEVAVIGYGSLMLKSSMELTLQRSHEHHFLPVKVKGWKRTWDISHPNQVDYTRYFLDENDQKVYPHNIIYLNITPARYYTMNVCLFVIKEEELAYFDEREKVYDRVDISERIIDNPVKDAPVWAYVGKQELVKREVETPKEAIIRQTYIDIVEEALDHHGPQFARDYYASTEDYPEHLVVDDFLEE